MSVRFYTAEEWIAKYPDSVFAQTWNLPLDSYTVEPYNKGMDTTQPQPHPAVRQRSEALADRVANLLGLLPEAIAIEPSHGRISLTNRQVETLLDLIESA